MSSLANTGARSARILQLRREIAETEEKVRRILAAVQARKEALNRLEAAAVLNGDDTVAPGCTTDGE